MNEPLKDGICVFLHNFQLRRNVQQQQRGAAAHFAVASESHEAATSYLSFKTIISNLSFRNLTVTIFEVGP